MQLAISLQNTRKKGCSSAKHPSVLLHPLWRNFSLAFIPFIALRQPWWPLGGIWLWFNPGSPRPQWSLQHRLSWHPPDRLASIGITDIPLAWLKSYLTGRTQFDQLKNIRFGSSPVPRALSLSPSCSLFKFCPLKMSQEMSYSMPPLCWQYPALYLHQAYFHSSTALSNCLLEIKW